MGFLKLYGRVLWLLGSDRPMAWGLGVAALALAGLQFLEPVLFGRVVDLLSRSERMTSEALWSEAASLLLIWGIVGMASIGANVAVGLFADRMAHRNRLKVMHDFFQHVLSLPLSFHGDPQSGRLMKVMLVGSDNLFGLWLGFFREHIITFVSLIVLLPLTMVMNWRLGLLLLVLVAVFAVVSTLVIRRTQEAQAKVEAFHSRLAGNAQDALSNVVVVQSFTRLNSEARMFGDIIRQVLDHQFPVLNWWAIVAVLTRAASTICVIAIFVYGTVLHVRGQATVGEIVSFMGFATLLIGRMEGAVGFVSHMVFVAPGIEEMFGVLDARSSVAEAPDAKDIGRATGDVAFEGVGFAYKNLNEKYEAIRYYELALSILLRFNDANGIHAIMEPLINLYLDFHHLDKAQMMYRKYEKNTALVFPDGLPYSTEAQLLSTHARLETELGHLAKANAI